MEIAKLPKNEKERVSSLLSYNILDSDFEKQYDDIVKLTSFICQTPISVISLVDSDRQWYKAKVGIKARETSRDVAFCAHAINQDDILIISDTLKDARFFDNPLVVEEPEIRFYAGAQLRTNDGYVLGTLCAIDNKPRELSTNQLDSLKVLASQVISMLELRRSYTQLENHTNKLNEQNEIKNKLFRIISHDLRSPFHSILGLAEILEEDLDELSKEEIKDLSANISETATDSFELVNNLLNWSLHQSELKERKYQLINLSKLFAKLLSVLGGVIAKKGINVNTELNGGSNIFADYNLIYSALQNILTNAIKFTPKDGLINILCKHSDQNTIIEIEDTGVGLSQVEIDALLSTNGKTSSHGTGGEKGTGLGFTIAKDFISLSGGKINIKSEKNKGTKVILSFHDKL